MEKVQGWLKAHWKPFAIAVAAGIVVWFFFLRKSSSRATAVTLPAGSPGGGGSAGGGAASGDTGAAAGASGPSSPWGKAASQIFDTFADWLSYFGQRGDVVGQSNQAQLQGEFQKEQQDWLARIKAGTGDLVPSPSGGAWWNPATGTYINPSATPATPGPGSGHGKISILRGSGFRGGDVLPSAFGDSRPAAARAAVAANLPAAPLGTSVAPKDLLAMDVRRAPRRQTSMAQVARGNPPPTMPQSFSVPIREHLEGSRPVLTVQATNPENEDAANPPSPRTPVATQAELASSDQKATNPAPMAAATPNIARGRKRFGTQRVPARPTQRWK